MLSWFKGVPRFFATMLAMLRLAWQAQPAVFGGLILLTTLQGLVPLTTAWLTKVLFDRLVPALQGDVTLGWVVALLPVLVAQALVFVVGQMLTPTSGYLNSELRRNLSLTPAVIGAVRRCIGIASARGAQHGG